MKPVVKKTKVSELFDFQDKVTLITGAGGVGEACARGFAEQGARVVLMDVRREACEKTRALVREMGLDADIVVADITSHDEVFAAVDSIAARYGRIDILLHTAGVTKNKGCLDYTEQELGLILGVNLTGTILINQAVGRVMKRQMGGKIIDIGSIGGLLSHMDESMPYEASKAAVHQVVRSFANELAPYHVNVNSIAPFWVNTPMIAHKPKEYFDGVYALTAFGRCLEPEELLGAAYFLACDASNFVTGQVIAVDGGYSTIKSLHTGAEKGGIV